MLPTATFEEFFIMTVSLFAAGVAALAWLHFEYMAWLSGSLKHRRPSVTMAALTGAAFGGFAAVVAYGITRL